MEGSISKLYEKAYVLFFLFGSLEKFTRYARVKIIDHISWRPIFFTIYRRIDELIQTTLF